MKYIIGLDEVGRGSLAGPVTVAAVAATVNSKIQISNSKLQLRDSKKLTPRQRDIWFEYIKHNPKIFYAIASVSPKIIDKINISQAANLAASRAFTQLIQKTKLKIQDYKVYLDGGLYLNKLKNKNKKLITKTIIKGDEKIPAIALASIAAKVTRDRLMIRLHKKIPVYNFKQHKGYGTKAHFHALKKYGPSSIHHRSFKPVLQSRRRGV